MSHYRTWCNYKEIINGREQRFSLDSYAKKIWNLSPDEVDVVFDKYLKCTKPNDEQFFNECVDNFLKQKKFKEEFRCLIDS